MVVQTNVVKVLFLVGLLVVIVMSLCWTAPRRAVPRSDLHGLALLGVCLYAVGGFALFLHRETLAGLVFAGGIVICALAVWLSRGVDSGDPPPDDEESADEPPPSGPDNVPALDWDEFEHAFRDYAARDPAETA
jgi:hypothetical protein